MYTIIFLLLSAISIVLIYQGVNRNKKSQFVLGALLGAITLSLSWFMGFWSEMLWFQSVGYGQRFWITTLTQWIMALASALLAAGLFSLLTLSVPRPNRHFKWMGIVLVIFMCSTWGYANWETFLKFWHGVETSVSDPILEKDTGFYLFTLPFLTNLLSILHAIVIIALAVSLLSIFVSRRTGTDIEFVTPRYPGDVDINLINAVFTNTGILLILLGAGKYLDRFQLMYSDWGVTQGPGWTDVNIRLPAYNIIMVLTFIAGIILLIPYTRKKFLNGVMRQRFFSYSAYPLVPGLMLLLVLALWFIGLTAIPGLFQALRVEPNEITFEKPYIAHNIEFTRRGFRLHEVETRQFPADDVLTPQIVENNKEILNNVRLWDWRALDAVYRQFQEIRLYYEFSDVDIDRYVIDGKYREVMVAAREIETDNLPQQSQNFVNKRFKYTHGYGITLTNVNEFTPQGLPNLLIKNIPPVSTYESLKIDRPEIYYGELTDEHVIVNSEESEFDYPQGEENVYVRYQGTGGVLLSNFWRKFIYSYKFDGTRLLFSSYPTDESRIMFHRKISDRVKTLAPFLQFENDAYIVLVDGRLKWIIDAYTTSRDYPYSEPFIARENIEYEEGNNERLLVTQLDRQLSGINYIRNSVKVVVDAYNGDTDFYIYDADDPLIQVWEKIFPELFHHKEDMPEELRRHVRYPEQMLLTQGLVFARYHMTDPEVFYNQEDLWVRATEKYYNQVHPVQPYYIMWQQPGSDKQEFVLILPFTPKNRQVLIGWIAGMSDPENYGKFIAYQFPKEKRILGPQQVETKIDQNSFLSSQLSLWSQRGSNVIRGNVLAIPIGETILYVEPIYLESETAAYPELRLVVVMHNDDLSYAGTFEEALQGLFGEPVAEEDMPPSAIDRILQPSPAEGEQRTLIQQANNAFGRYLELTGQKKFNEAAEELERLQELLQELAGQEEDTD